jgi:hypothetical protein
MRTSTKTLLALATLSAVGLSRYFSAPATPPAEPQQESTASAQASLPQPTRAASPPKGAAPPSHIKTFQPTRTQGGDDKTVEFRVVDGLAIAYGDVILGKVESGANVDKGRYEPPQPQLWEKPEVPYAINPELADPSRVERAIAYFNQHTPVTFVPRADQADALVFETGSDNCFSALGKTGGLQPIRLAPGCQTQEILHEMMHALGFVHEQSRPDRDQYVEILWDNIEEKYRSQFAVVPDAWMEVERGTPFDFRSVMLYRPDTFAAHPGETTLKPTQGRPAIDPVQQGLSEGDLQRLKRMYRL